MRVLLIGVGGFVGSILRYWISGILQQATPRSSFPIGTLAVNVTGCLAIGVLSELAESRGFLGPDTRAFLAVGLFGGFTTFSAFANETVAAARDGSFGTAIINVAATVAACLTAVWVGRALVNLVWR